jgi:Family of unknown function (DUF6893)
MSKAVIAAAAVVGGVGAVVYSQLPEIRRYLKVESM